MSADWPALGHRTYLDANLYIYVFEGIETHRARMVELPFPERARSRHTASIRTA